MQNDKQRSFSDVSDFIKNLSDIIDENFTTSTSNLPEEVRTFSDNINIIVTDHNLQILFLKIKKQIADILASTNKDTSECKKEAESQVLLLEQNAQSSVESCVSDMQVVANELTEEFKKITEKAKDIKEKIMNLIMTCSEKHKDDPARYRKCLKTGAEDLKEDFYQLKQISKDVMDASKQTIEQAMVQFKQYLDKEENNTKTEGDNIVDNLNKCILAL